MNIALPALVIFACLLPGFVFRSRLKLVESTSLDYSPFGRVASEGILWTACLHAVWIALCPLFGTSADLGLLLRLLSSNLAIYGEAVTRVSQQTTPIVGYFGSLYAAAYLVPTLLRKLISSAGLDRFDSPGSALFRFDGAPWYYLLTGADFADEEKPDYILATAIMDVGGDPYIFRGILESFYFKTDGSLDRLVMSDVARRKLADDKNTGPVQGRPRPLEERFYPVDGDSFVIQYDQVITLNIQYVKLTEVSETEKRIIDRHVAAEEAPGVASKADAGG